MAASFRRTAWTFPAAYVAHVAEEAPGFTAWARRNASERYTQTDFVRNNALGFVSTIAATVAITRSERRALGLAYYTLVLTQRAIFKRALSRGHDPRLPRVLAGRGHLRADAAFVRRLTSAALAEDRLSRRDVVACTVLAGIVHAAVIARQVYFVGLPRGRAAGSSGRSRVRSDGSDSSRT